MECAVFLNAGLDLGLGGGAGGGVDNLAGRLVGGVEFGLGALVADQELVDTVAEQARGFAQVGGQDFGVGLGIGGGEAGGGLLGLVGGQGGGQLGELLLGDALLLEGGEVVLGLVVDVFGNARQVVVGGAAELVLGVVGGGVEADVVLRVGVGEQGGGDFGGALGQVVPGGFLDGSGAVGIVGGLLGVGGGVEVLDQGGQLGAGGAEGFVGGVDGGVLVEYGEGGLHHRETGALLIIHDR